MLHFLRKIGAFIDTMEYIPRIYVLNPARNFLHHWFPQMIAPVCRNGDFICSHSNGLIKLADVVPNFVMDGADLMAEYPYRTLGVLAGSTGLLTAYLYYRHHNQPQRASAEIRHPERRQLHTAFLRTTLHKGD